MSNDSTLYGASAHGGHKMKRKSSPFSRIYLRRKTVLDGAGSSASRAPHSEKTSKALHVSSVFDCCLHSGLSSQMSLGSKSERAVWPQTRPKWLRKKCCSGSESASSKRVTQRALADGAATAVFADDRLIWVAAWAGLRLQAGPPRLDSGVFSPRLSGSHLSFKSQRVEKLKRDKLASSERTSCRA